MGDGRVTALPFNTINSKGDRTMKKAHRSSRPIALLGSALLAATLLSAAAVQAADRTVLIENFTADW